MQKGYGIYLCDGKDPKCLRKEECYLNDGACCWTNDISHAKSIRTETALHEIKKVISVPILDPGLDEKEKRFLITCIMLVVKELKYEKLSRLEVIDLVRKLDGKREDIEKLLNCF